MQIDFVSPIPEKADFFVSYNGADAEIARWVAYCLEEDGYVVDDPSILGSAAAAVLRQKRSPTGHLGVKGCWHRDVQTAMENQPRDRYLAENNCGHGIYVVLWTKCSAWDDQDPARVEARRNLEAPTIGDAQVYFDEQARILSRPDAALSAFVLYAGYR